MINYYKMSLENGLRIVVAEMPHLHSLEISIYIKAGSRFENLNNNGISHFLEHALFRGSQNIPDSYQFHKRFESLGGDINAFTSSEYTCFWLTLHPEYLAEGMAIFAEMFLSPGFADIDIEKQIVLEEIINEQNEKGEDINIDNLSSLMLWPNDSLGFPPLGSKENLLRFTKEDIQTFFNHYYAASNMVLCIAGKVNHEQVFTCAPKYFSSLPAGKEAVIKTKTYTQTCAQTLFKKNPGSQTNVQICFRSLSYNSPYYHALMLLRRILDDGNASLLQWNIREKQGLVYDISASISSYYDTGTFDIDFSVAPEKVVLVVDEVLRELKKLATDPISIEEFERAKHRHILEFDFYLDSVAKIADWFGWSELFHLSSPLEAERKKVEMVTREQIFNLCKGFLINSGLNIVVVGQYTRQQSTEVKKLAKLF